MILSQQISEADAQEMLSFYQANFDTVDLVRCEQCHSAVCLELTGPDPMGLQVNDLGKIIVPIGDTLAGHRVRLDHASSGERMVGYQCGNLIQNANYEADHEAWLKARDKHEADFEASLNAYIDKHEAKLKPHRAAYDKKVSQLLKEDDRKRKTLKPGEPLPKFELPPFDMPEGIVYEPPAKPAFDLPEPQEWVPCGNDTRLAEVEVGLVPTGDSVISLSPFEKMKISETIIQRGHHGQYKQVGNKKYFETFSVERIK